MCSASPKILVLFVCKSCRSSFSLIDEFIKHKTARHYDEFKQINCVIFEEQISYGHAGENGNHGIPTHLLSFEPEVHFYTLTGQTDQQDNHSNLTDDSLNCGIRRDTDPDPLVCSRKFIKCEEPHQNIQIDAVVGNFSDGSTATGTKVALGHDLVENSEAIKADTFDLIIGGCEIQEKQATKIPSVKRTWNPSVNLKRLTLSQILKASSSYQTQNDTVIKLEHDDDNDNDVSCSSPIQVPVPVSDLDLDFDGDSDPFLNQRQIHSSMPQINKLNAPPVPLPSAVQLNQEIFDAPTTTTARSDVEPSPAANLTCKLCLRKFKDKVELQTHVNICSLIPRSRSSRECVLCNKLFCVSYLQEHMLRVHGTEEEKDKAYKLKCKVCSKKFLCHGDLLVHMNSHKIVLDEECKPFKCQECGRSFLTKRFLTRHLGRLHLKRHAVAAPLPVSDLDLNCKLCLKKYKSQGELNIHLTICKLYHEGGDSFCVSCNKLFSSALSFKDHMLTFHATEEEKKEAYKFKCQHCTKIFLRNRELLVHMESHKRKDERSKPFKCKECDRSFLNKEYLRKHFIRIHSHDKPFKI